MAVRDPYDVLGVRPGATDAAVRAAYRRLVQRHHPDHNAGSPESARRFEEVQEAYAAVKELRKRQPPRPRTAGTHPNVDARLDDLERQVREARERAARAAADARERFEQRARRPSDEELGYFRTEDSFGKILADAGAELGRRLDEARDEIEARIKAERRKSSGA